MAVENTRAVVDRVGVPNLLVGVLFAALFVTPLVVTNEFYLRILTFACIWGGAATAWNIFSGYSGLFSFGHSIFFGIGALASTLFLTELDVTPWAGMLVGGVVAGVTALVIGLILFRLSGIFFGLAMLTIPMATIPILRYLDLNRVPIPFIEESGYLYMSFRDITGYYYVTLTLLLVCVYITYAIKTRSFGGYLFAIKNDEDAARALGIDVQRYKTYAFVISAFLTSLFGAIYSQAIFLFTPESTFGLDAIIQPIIFTTGGGIGTVIGPTVGALILYPTSEILRSTFGTAFGGINFIFYGVAVIVIILYFPDGVVPKIADYLEARE